MTIGAVLDETCTLFTRFFLRFFVIALVVFAAVNLVEALEQILIGSTIVARAAVLPFSAIAIAITYVRLREAGSVSPIPGDA